MGTNSEVGIEKNLQNLNEANSQVESYGAVFQPSNDLIKLVATQLLYTETSALRAQFYQLNAISDIDINTRQDLVAALKPDRANITLALRAG